MARQQIDICSACCWALVAFGNGIIDHETPVGAEVATSGVIYGVAIQHHPASSIGRVSENGAPSADVTMPVTIYECPLAACPWKGTDPPPPPGEAITSDADIWRFIRDRAMAAEEVVRAHLETHSLLEWAQEIMRLRGELDRERRDSGIVAGSLLRRLGGSAFVSDSELSGMSATLRRIPVANGFILEVA